MQMDPRVLQTLKVSAPGMANLPAIDIFLVNRLCSLKPYTVQISQDDEYDYIDEYEKRLSPIKVKREEEEKNRRERMHLNQEKIRIKEEESKKKEMEDIDEKFSKQLMEEEKKQLEREIAERKKGDDQEHMVLQVITKFPFVDYDSAKIYLGSTNWNLNEVESMLSQQYQEKMNEDDKKETMILQLIQNYPNLEYDQAQQLLEHNGYNYDAVVNQMRMQQSFRINFAMIGQNNTLNLHHNPQYLLPQIETLSSDFNQNDSAMQMLTYLEICRPTQGQYYKIYKDPYFNQQISYLELSMTFKQLNIQPNTSFFVKKDSTPPV